MIRKSELMDAINGLSHDLTRLSIKVSNLQQEVDDMKTDEVEVCVKPVKRGRGRPRKNTQPQEKSGKSTNK